MLLQFTPTAAKDLEKLPPAQARRIVKKMQWYAVQEKPLSFAKRLTDSRLGSYRFRVGDYRVLIDIVHGALQVILVLSVENRKNAYRL